MAIKISNITSSANQVINIPVPGSSGKTAQLTLSYIPTNMAWYYSIIYDNFILNNRRVVQSLNIMLPYVNTANFGIACLSNISGNPRDPYLITDFIDNSNSKPNFDLYVLSYTEASNYLNELTTYTLSNDW